MCVVTRFMLCICYVGSKKECQAEEDYIIDEESNQFDNYGYEGDDYDTCQHECQNEETENLESNESEKLLDKKLEEEHIEDEGNEGKTKMKRLTTQEIDSKKRKRRKLKDKACSFNQICPALIVG